MLALRTTTDGTAGTGPVAAPAAAAATTAVAVVAAAHAGVDAVSGSVAALVPTLEGRFELSGSQVGLLLATLSSASMLSQPVVGRVADRVGAKKVAAAGAITAAALLSLLGVVGHIAVVYGLLVAGGLGSAAFHPAAAVAARRALPERASLAISLFSAGGMVGLALGPVAVLLLTAHAGLGFTPLLMIPGVALGAALWRIIPDELPRSEPPTTDGAARLLRGPVGAVAAAGMLVGLASVTFHAGLPLWLTRHGGFDADAALIGWTLGAFDLAAALGGLASAWAASRIAPSRLAAPTLGAAPIALAATLLAEPGSAPFFVACVAAGALVNAGVPLLMVGAQDLSRGAVAAASGLMGFASGAAGIAFIGVGQLIDATSLTIGLSVGFAALLPAAAIAGRSLGRRPSSGDVLDLVAAGCGCGACRCPAV